MSDIIRSWSIEQEADTSTYKYICRIGGSEDPNATTKTVTITGLSLGGNAVETYNTESDGDEPAGIYLDLTSHTVEISKALLVSTSRVSITGDADYMLALNTDVVTKVKAAQKYGWVVAGTSATYYLYDYDYYALGSGSKSISYVDESSVTGTGGTSIASIDNLASLTAGNYSTIDGISVKTNAQGNNTGVIELTKEIVGPTSSTLTDLFSGKEKGGSIINYTIALEDNDGVDDNKVGFGETYNWSFADVGSLSRTGTYTKATAAGWALSSDEKTINYTGSSSVNLLSLSGLATGAVSSAITVGTGTNKYVTLGDSAIGTTTIKLNVLAGGTSAGYTDYNLAFEKDHTPSVGAASLSYAAAGSSSYTATRYQITGSGFVLSGQSATYASASTKEFFTITGLSSNKGLTVSTTQDSDGEYVVTLGQSALGSAGVHLDDKDMTDKYKYKLALGAGVKGSEKGDNYFSITDAGGNSKAVTYQFDTTEGWALSGTSIVNYTKATTGNKLFSLSGLSSTVSLGGNSLIAGISFTEKNLGGNSTNYIVTLDNSVLGSQSVYLKDLNINDNINYSLSLAAGVRQTQAESNDFDVKTAGTSSTVTYRLNKTDAWKVVGDSVMYTGESLANALFKLEGLSNNLTTGTLSALTGISVTENKSIGGTSKNYIVTLDNSVLLAGQSVQLTDADANDNINFSLSLAANVTAPATIDSVGHHWDVVTASGGTSSTATYHYFSQAGYSIVGNSAVYYGTKENKFVTIEGLSANLTAEALSAGINFTEGTSAITLSRAVLAKDTLVTVSITDNDSSDSVAYHLALNDDATIGSVSDAVIRYVRNENKVYVRGYLEDYYTLGGESTSITYTKKDDKIGNLIKVTGLKIENNALEGASVDSAKKTITLSAEALSSGTGVSLAAIAGGRSFYGSFSFALTGGISDTQIYDYKDKVWSVSGTSATFSQEVLAGHKLSANGESVTYSNNSVGTAVFMTLTGISAGATSTAISEKDKTVYLSDEAIGTSSISLSINATDYSSLYAANANNNYSGYELEFLNDHSQKTGASYFSTETVAAAASGVSYGKVEYQQYTTAGFSFNAERTTATYSGDSMVTFFSISGIADVGTTNDRTKTSITGININSTSGIITLDKGVLTKTDVYLTDNYEADGIDYKLRLASNVNRVTDWPNYWGVSAVAAANGSTSSTTITYKYDTTEGWALDGTSKVQYTKESTGLSRAVLTGLKADLKLSPAGATSIDDITVNGSGSAYTIKLGKGVLGSQSVSLQDNANDKINYSLSLAGDYSAKKGSGYFGVSSVGGKSKAVTYQFDTTEGWALSGTSIVNYTAATTGNKLFTLEGLSSTVSLGADSLIAGITVTQASISGASTYYTVTLDNSVLGGMSVKLTDDNTADDYYFSLSLSANVTAPATIDSDGHHWDVETDGTSSTAKWLYNSKAGYSLASDSLITYESLTSYEYLTITGLSANLTAEALAEGISFAEGTSAITLTRTVLGDKTVTITDNDNADNVTYHLALDANATVGEVKDASLSASNNGIMGYRGEYYTLNGTSQVTYTGASSSFKLVGISGISIAGNNFTGTSLSGNTIILSASSFTKSDVSLSGNYNNTYSLSIAGADGGNLNDYGDNYWTVNSGTAKYEQEVYIGYTLQDDKQSVSYSKGKLQPNHFMTITGLSTGATSSAISLTSAGGQSYVVLGDSAIGSTSIFLNANDSAYDNYSLSFANFDKFKRDKSTEYWSVSDTSYTYNQDTNAGFLPVSGKSAFYVGLSTANFFTITGLSAGLTDSQSLINDSDNNSGKHASLTGVTIDNNDNTITVGDAALFAGQNVIITGGESYTFVLGTAKVPSSLDTSKGDKGNYWTAGTTNGAFILKNDTKDGFEIGANSRAINYVGVSSTALATIAGLSTAVSVGTNGYLYIDSTSVGKLSTAGDSTTFELTSLSMLGGTSVSITGDNYYLDVDTDEIKAPKVKDSNKYWVGSSNDATIIYRYDTTAGYSLAESGKVLEYSPLKHTDELTITGLSAGISQHISGQSVGSVSGFASGLGITLGSDSVISLDSRALAGTNVSMSGDSNYKFYFNPITDENYYSYYKAGSSAVQSSGYSVATKARESYEITAATTAATVKARNEAYYTLGSDSRTITYTPASIGSALATIAGLSKGFKAGNLTVRLAGTSTTDPGVITLDQKALGTSDITLKNATNYKLALETGINAPVFDPAGWSVTGVGTKTATYTTKVTNAGHTVSLDGKTVHYTVAGDNKVLFKITGLSSAVTAENNLLPVDKQKGTVTLNKEALGTSTIKFTTNELNYKFELDSSSIRDKAVYANVWRVEGTTATFKQVILGYNEINDKNEVIYHAEAEVPNKEYAKITGLTGTFYADDDDGSLYLVNEGGLSTKVLEIVGGDSSFVLGSISAAYDPDKDTTKAGGTITILDGNALSQNAQVKLTGASYVFVLSSDIKPAVNANTQLWEVSGTTAYYKASVSAGFKLTDDTTIQYVPEGQMTLASITGLNAGITVDTAGATGNNLGYKSGDNFTAGVSVSSNTFTVDDNAMLGLSNAVFSAETVTGAEYSLDIGSSVSTSSVAEAKKWVISGTSASYANYKPTYYTLKDNVIECTPATQIGNTIATISGLSTSVTVNASGSIGALDENGTFRPGLEINESAKSITLSKNVLGTSNVSAGQYYLYTDSAVASVATNDYVMTFENGTATVNQTPSAYYTGSGTKTLTYHAPGTTSTATTITGLLDGLNAVTASGNTLALKTVGNNAASAVEIDTATKTVTIYEDALKDGEDYQPSVKVTGDYTITRAADVTALEPKKQDTNNNDYQIWTIDTDKGTATLSKGQTAGYSLSTDGKELTYTEAQATKDAAATVTIKGDGLKKIKLGDGSSNYLNTIEGVTVDSSSKIVTVIEDFLKATNSDIEVSDGYTLAIASESDDICGFGEGTPAVDYKNGTLTYTAKTNAGWILEQGKIKYYAPGETSTTLSGLNTTTIKNNVTFEIEKEESGTYVGYTSNDGTFTKVLEVTERTLNNDGTLKEQGTLTLLTSEILKTGNATFTLSSKNNRAARDYDLEFGKGDKLISDVKQVWSLNSKGALVYADDVAAGTYTLTANEQEIDGKKVVTSRTITYNKKSAAESSPIVTLAGLDKDKVTPTNGAIEGITVKTKGASDGNGGTVEDSTVTLGETLLKQALTADNAKVTLTNGKGNSYVLATDSDTTPKTTPKYWAVSKDDGKATYKDTTSAGYTFNEKKDTLTHTASKDTVYFELSGLNKDSEIVKNFKAVEDPSALNGDQDFEAVDLNEIADNTYSVTLKDTDALNKTANAKVTLTAKNGKKHTLEIVEALKPDEVDQVWKKTKDDTAELKSGVSGGYEAKGTTATYKAPVLKTTIAKITGLTKDIAEDTLESCIGVGKSTNGTYTFTLSDTLLEEINPTASTKIVAAKGSAKDVELALESDKNEATTSEAWTIKTGKATFDRGYKNAGYVLSADGKTLSYATEDSESTTVLTITGLDKTFVVSEPDKAEDYINYNDKTKTVTLDDKVLGTSNITIACTENKSKTSEYAITASADKMDKTAKDFWAVSGTTATYGNGTAAHFVQKNNQTLTYVKEKMSKKYFTISGIQKGATDIEIDETAGTITIGDAALGTKNITLKKATKDISGYKLVLANNGEIAEATEAYANGNYTRTLKEGKYSISSDGKTITYITSKNKSTVLYQIKNASGTDSDVTTEGKKVTLTADALKGNKTITLTDKSKEGYGFVNDGGITGAAPTLSEADANVTVTEKSGTGTLNGSVSGAGFYFTDSTTLTYVKAGTFKATIKGLANNDKKKATELEETKLNANSRTIDVATSDVSDAKKVTVDGGGVVGFSFDAELGTKSKTATIAGGAKNDTITAESNYVSIDGGAGSDHINATGTSKVTVTGGKGNDYITVGSGASVYGNEGNDVIDFTGNNNTFYYKLKDGDDVITYFDSTDKISLSGGATVTTVTASGNDVVISLADNKGKSPGTITLKDMAGQDFYIGTAKYNTSSNASNGLLYSDNYGTSADLGELTKESSDYSVGEIETSNNTSLTKDQTQLTFGKK